MPPLPGPWKRIPLQLVLFTAAAVSILTGASFNVQGHAGATGLIAILSGLLACAAGAFHRRWKVAAGLAGGSVLLIFAEAFFVGIEPIGINFTGLISLALGGVVGSVGYTNVTQEMRRRLKQLERLNGELEEKHRAFLAATEDVDGQAADLGLLAKNLAAQTGSGFCCFFLASAAGEFVPQEPAAGFDKVRPQPLSRRRSNALLEAIEAGTEYYGEDVHGLRSVLPYLPPDFRAGNYLAIPLKVGDRVQGFVLLGNRPRGFSEDDRRLARTLAMRAGIRLASASDVASSQEEASRYSLLNQMMKQASTLPFNEAMRYLVESARDLVSYDAARTAVFQPDDTFMIAGSPMSYPLERSPLAKVKAEGRSVIRAAATRSDGLFSGVDPGGEGQTAAEALVPIRGKQDILGALCFGRVAPEGFDEKEIPILEEIGAIAGVAAENARAVQQVARESAQRDRSLDNVRQALETIAVTAQGAPALEQKLLETACRILDCRYALMTQRAGADAQRVTSAVGFPAGVVGMQIHSGQGVIGSVIQTEAPFAVSDVSDGFDLASPPDLASLHIHGALSAPMGESQLLGTISVFTESRRDWSDAEKRLLTTVAAQAIPALKNAEMYDSVRRRVWELSKGAGDNRKTVVPLLHRFAAAIDARDTWTAGRSARVMQYATVIAKELNYARGDEGAWQRLRDGALMLDIGKVSIPDAILSKRDLLTPQEMQMVRNHTIFGYDLLNGLQMFTDELVIVRSHHERYDGAGYPDGTRGDELPLVAYIIGAADAVDAMVSERPHRGSKSIEVALAEVEKGAAKQFHPDVATAILDSAVRGTLKVIRQRPVSIEPAGEEAAS